VEAVLNVIGLMRVRNEARWIQRAVESILPLCQRVVVLDDHSTDYTPDICAAIPGVELIPSRFHDLDESRDKNFLLDIVRNEAEWALMIDGDEILMETDELRRAMASTKHQCVSLRVLYAWDREDQIRVDGVYGNFRRQSAFRPGTARFHSRGAANFHCGSVPPELRSSTAYVNSCLLHLGYRDKADRIRKFAWYRANDPSNFAEDEYFHMVQGDIPEVPINAARKHAGPLKLLPLSDIIG
jgi:O-antigen biosynthesis protein